MSCRPVCDGSVRMNRRSVGESGARKSVLLSDPQTATAGCVLEWDAGPPAAAAAAGQGRHCVRLNVSQCAAGEPPRGRTSPPIRSLNRGPERQRDASLWRCVPTFVSDTPISCQRRISRRFSPTSEEFFLVLVPDHQLVCTFFIPEETPGYLLSILSWSLPIGSLIRQELLRKLCFKVFITTLVPGQSIKLQPKNIPSVAASPRLLRAFSGQSAECGVWL